MAKFISVLDPDSAAPFWTAVQWANTLEALRANHYYSAEVNLTIPKGGNKVEVDVVKITEVNTHETTEATILQLSAMNSNFVRLASTKASKHFLKTLMKIGGNNGR